MRFLRRSLTGVFLMALTVALFAYAGSLVTGAARERMSAEPRTMPQRERVQAVNVVAFAPATVAPVMTAFGELRSRRTLDLRAPAGGTVLAVSEAFAEGGRVSAGEVLLRIDPTEAEDAVARARADLADAEAESRDAERALALGRDALAAAEAQAALRDRALARQRDLQGRGIGTAPELEAAEIAASSAAQSVLNARQSIAAAEARIDQASTRIDRSRLGLAQAERTLADTVIRAAFDGTLAEVAVGPGGRVTANEQVARLIDPDLLEVAFRLSAAQYALLLDDQGALIRAPVTVGLEVADLTLTARGTIDREAATVGAGQTGRQIFARLDTAAGFRPGDFVTVAIEEPPLDRVARLPATALAADGTILVPDAENRLQVVPVTLLRRQGDDVLVRAEGPEAALPEGASVVAARTPLLGAGILVRPIGPGAEPGAEPGAAPGAEAAAAAAQPATIRLDEARRARLVAFVEGSDRMPPEAKSRLLAQLGEAEVPAEVVARLESRMGS